MYAELLSVDPQAAAAIHPNNRVRVLRALEHYRATGRRLSEQKAASRPSQRPYRSLVLGLDFADRAQLYRRIDLRVDRMMEQGLLEEAGAFREARLETSAQAIGYKELFPYLEGEKSLPECLESLKQATRRYAKRQLTWFRRDERIYWVYPDEAGPEAAQNRALGLAERFLSGELLEKPEKLGREC